MKRLSVILAALALTAGLFPASSLAAPWSDHVAGDRPTPRASTYPLTPLLTGGILETTRQVTLDQGVRVRQKEPWEGCSPYADGQLNVTESTQATTLVDLGYEGVPRANPTPPTTILPADTKISGSMSFQGESWACDGDEAVLAQGGSCTRSFTPGFPGRLIEPEQYTLDANDYQPGASQSVVGVANYNPGWDCLMRNGQVPMAIGLYTLDYWGDGQFHAAFQRPSSPLKQTKATVNYDMSKSDASCVHGENWWQGQHGAGMYMWTQAYDDYIPEDLALNCSSVRKGFARTSVERALVINELRVFQMTPAGDYAEVPPSEAIVDGNTVKIEMLIENRWKKDITAPIQLWDSTYKRKIEVEKDQQNPFTDTFVAGAQKKVTFLWRTDGVAWETPGKPIYQRAIDILTPFGGAQTTVIVKPRPALLLHGWKSSPSAWDDWPGFVKSVRTDWDVQTVNGMNTDPANGVTIQQNAGTLKTSVETIRRTTKAVHVDLIGHSMGGLISRWYLSRMMGNPAKDGRPIARSLTMFGTPNLGSDCAYWVLGGGMAANGANYLTGKMPSFATGSYTPTYQLTPWYLAGEFRAQTPPKSGVYYSIRAGVPLPNFYCGLPGRLITQTGRNDGPVPLTSAIGGGLGGAELAPPDYNPLTGIHTQMTGARSYFDLTVGKVVGLGPPEAIKLIKTRSRISPQADATVAAEPARGAWAAGAEADFDGSVELTLQTPGGSAQVGVSAPDGTTFTVLDPDGKELGTGPATSWPSVVSGATGAGTIRVRVTGSADISGEVQASLYLPNDARTVSFTSKRTGSRLTISATVTGTGASTAKVQALVNPGTQGQKVVTFRRKGETFTGTSTVSPGSFATVMVLAQYGTDWRMTFGTA